MGRASEPSPRPPRRWPAGCVFVAVVLLLLALLTLGQPLRPALTRQPQTFTELYFTDSTRTTTIHDGPDGKVTMSFTIRNAEGRPSAYSYVVTVNGRTQQQGTTPLIQDAATFDVTVSGLVLPKGGEPVRLQVELAGGQTIRTWARR
ncbi:hypothetical protein [Kineosporia babensis]|uniref:Uncharacterized protein n=1 Tax=Kineosporia babensis TaxID=499548 RepID=A0A9X1NDJ6_9ACTN|nr:hypothetical protein [Kineosporia babensis]MCD5311286.1 hypothetical protein [Kineosporia babensis]